MSIELFGKQVVALQRIETRMGEMAGVLSDLADALSSHPDGIMIEGVTTPLPAGAVLRPDACTLRAKEFPSIEDVQRILAEWHAEMAKARSAWESLPDSARELMLPPGAGPAVSIHPVV